ncbi:MAG: spermidine/putrescine ABC transporter substrate-binding protein [Actinobacteria bacterium]|nr:spermidine/putrescine ABC transporter substrate-binding protein [Actinomycetota bacterium]
MTSRKRTRIRPLIAFLLAFGLIAAACSSGDDATEPTKDTASTPTTAATGSTEPSAAVSGRCGDPARLGDSINFLNWADYIDEAVLEQFEEECGVSVTMETHTANEEAIAKIQAGNSGFSLVIVTDYAVGIMRSQDLLQPLDLTEIPNAKNLDPAQMDLYYDPGNVYSLPYQYSTTGIAYDETAFEAPPTSWSALYGDNQYCGQSSLLEDQRETVGSALLYLGYGINETDPAAHEQALNALLEAKDCISAFDSANFIGNLASGEVLIAESWGFAAGIAYLDNPNIRYVIPEEGGFIWQDNFVIPADAPDPYTAHVFTNYMLEPDIGALITEYTFGYTPNALVPPLLSGDYNDVIETVGLTLTDEIRDRLDYTVRDDEHAIFAKTWSDVMAGG